MDNARIHHGDEIIELIEGHGILLNLLTTLLTCFRRMHWIPSSLFSWLESNWRSFLEGQGISSSSSSTSLHRYEWDYCGHDGCYGMHYSRGCERLLPTCRILLNYNYIAHLSTACSIDVLHTEWKDNENRTMQMTASKMMRTVIWQMMRRARNQGQGYYWSHLCTARCISAISPNMNPIALRSSTYKCSNPCACVNLCSIKRARMVLARE